MIQELISTSAPRCLNGNAGFGIVAQTRGMAPNVSLAVDALSGYTHIAAAGSGKNPTVYLHAIRRTGGKSLHVVSRVADCGNDYSGRTNRIAHHLVIDEGYVRNLPGGPANLVAQNIFRHNWSDKPGEIPPRNLHCQDVPPKKCVIWERMTGDAGWGGIVAEHAERVNPISIIFSPEQHNSEHLQVLIGEALALLPSQVRWRVTFSTYYMQSQETSSDKIQIKCVLSGSESRQSPNTLMIDLRQRLAPVSAGKYVDLARGVTKQSTPTTPPKVQSKPQVPAAITATPLEEQVYELLTPVPVPGVPKVSGNSMPTKKTRIGLDYSGGDRFAYTDSSDDKNDYKTILLYSIGLLIILLIVGGVFAYKAFGSEVVKQLGETRKQLQIAEAKNEMLEQRVNELEDIVANRDQTICELLRLYWWYFMLWESAQNQPVLAEVRRIIADFECFLPLIMPILRRYFEPNRPDDQKSE